MAAMPTKQVDIILTFAASASRPLSETSNKEFYLKEGLEGQKHHEYSDEKSFTSVIESRVGELCAGNFKAGQYVVFHSVKQSNIEYIGGIRNDYYKELRFMHFPADKILIVKIVLGMLDDLVTTDFTDLLKRKIAHMGPDCGLGNLRSAAFKGMLGLKEPDVSLKPRFARPNLADWPTLVFECGIKESLERLKVDSRWWLEDHGRAVNIVLLFTTSRSEKKIHIEQWELSPVPNPQLEVTTGGHPSSPILSPTRTCQIDILPSGTSGAPLTLSFEKIFLRPPIEALGEGDIVLTGKELQDYAARIWDFWQAVMQSSD